MKKHALFIREDQQAKLDHLAAEANVSIAEIASRAIDAFDLNESNKEAELELLLDAANQSTIQAMKDLNSAYAELKKTLVYFSNKEKNQDGNK